MVSRWILTLSAAAWLAGAAGAWAQEQQQAGPPAPPSEGARPRDVAVPRGEGGRVREPQPARADAPPPRPPAAPASGASRRPPAAPPASITPRADASQRDAGQRPGAVRRPPETPTPRNRAVPRTSRPPSDRDHWRYPDYSWRYRHHYDPFYGGLGFGHLVYTPWGWVPSFYATPVYGTPYVARGYNVGSVKLKVKPRDAEVFVDGYYAGVVDDFDGIWQSLKLDSGAYTIEVRKPGYESLWFDVRVQPDRTITFRGELVPLP